MMNLNSYLIGYLVLINAFGLGIMFLDKQFAKTHQWRIRESTLLSVAFLGGALGSLFGMLLFLHKTRKRKFQILGPLFLLLQIGLYWYFFLK